jgi:hypothetical protein
LSAAFVGWESLEALLLPVQPVRATENTINNATTKVNTFFFIFAKSPL